ncbi:MAG: hypothetical protein OCC46_13240 [Pseudodesulfovibrio sp.]
MSDHINELFDKDGELIGCLLSAEAWNHVKKDVFTTLGLEDETPVVEKKEPTGDWEYLKASWDYPYPVDTDVHCEHCGNATEDWADDEPRLFRMTSANIAGLVSFKCMKCQAKISKKHFNKEIKTECTPYQDKDLNKEARY